MDYRKLGRSEIKVSAICLGTMTWGEQNSEADAHAQLDFALDHGVNFIDTAEMYPVPPRADTAFRTERYIGNWLAARGNRDRVVIATKVSGRSSEMNWIRGGPKLDRANIAAALDASLKRLRTDYLDLYQLHWPDRKTNYFGHLGYRHAAEDRSVPIEETLDALARAVTAGKVRQIGLSNETPWGTMRFLATAEARGLPRMVSIQNPYNLLNRSFEVGLAEIAHRESVGLLAYSPLGFGVLSGKYLDGMRPAGARITLYGRFSRYSDARAEPAVAAYVALARECGLDPAQMALAFVTGRPFVAATIIGATTMAQLASNVDSARLTLPKDVLARIEGIHAIHTIPCP
jgi:aryl-alcohol dehydrogenase-like predicted oxidoreductase